MLAEGKFLSRGKIKYSFSVCILTLSDNFYLHLTVIYFSTVKIARLLYKLDFSPIYTSGTGGMYTSYLEFILGRYCV